jgi:hypothetical protein
LPRLRKGQRTNRAQEIGNVMMNIRQQIGFAADSQNNLAGTLT